MSDNALKTESSAVIQWSRKVPLVTNMFILKDMAFVLGTASLFLLVLFVLISGGESMDAMILLWAAITGLIVIVFLFSMIVIMWNHVGMEFMLDDDGVGFSAGKRERRMNTAAVVIGALGRSPGAAGAGLLAKSSESGYYEWAEIKKVIFYPKQKVIDVKSGLIAPIRLYCTTENYAAVERTIREKAKNASIREKNGAFF